ncbi:MAG: DsbA family protein [Armatimonadota bacterium]
MSNIFSLRPRVRRDTVALYHDYLCPWCWVGFLQAEELEREFGLQFEWIGAELFPPDLEGPPSNPGPQPPRDPARAKDRFDRFCDEESVDFPEPRPGFVRTHAAMLGAEHARAIDPALERAWHAAVYKAYWLDCADIEDIAVLRAIGESVGLDPDALEESIRAERHADAILPFDDPAYASGIRNVPTFVFGANEQLAEANLDDLRRATERFLIRRERLRPETL